MRGTLFGGPYNQDPTIFGTLSKNKDTDIPYKSPEKESQ